MNANERSEVLHGMTADDPAAAADRLDTVHVIVDVAPDQGPLGLSLTNLLARLIPNVELTTGSTKTVSLPIFGSGTLRDLATSIVRAGRPPLKKRATTTFRVAVGTADHGADLHVSSSRWSMRLSQAAHVPLTGVGPATTAASALAAAEIIRRLVPELPGSRLGSALFEWNLLDYQCSLAPEEVHLAPVDAVCFGGGSVGSSVVYSLLLGAAKGRLTIIDPDKLSRRNRVRYPALLGPTEGSKVEWLERLAAGSELAISGIRSTAAEYVRSAGPMQLAIAAVDTVDGRRQVGDLLARRTLNVGVAADQFHVSRHGFADGYACVYCGYLTVGDPLDAAAVYADMTGLSVERTTGLLGGDALTADDVHRLLVTGVVDIADVSDLVGARLVDVVRQRLYAQVVPRTELGVGEPMAAPYVSALAGATVAAEMQKGPRASRFWLDRRIDVDCSGRPTGFQSRPNQDDSGRCLCASTFRVKAYRQMWSEGCTG